MEDNLQLPGPVDDAVRAAAKGNIAIIADEDWEDAQAALRNMANTIATLDYRLAKLELSLDKNNEGLENLKKEYQSRL